MKKFTILLATLLFTPVLHAQTTLELFGQSLRNATRPQLRDALKKSGLEAVRVDDHYWTDKYNPADSLGRASELMVGYVSATNRFAIAEYTFSAFMETGWWEKS